MFNLWKHRLGNPAKTLRDSRSHDNRREDAGHIQWHNRDDDSMRLMWAHCKLQCPSCGHIVIHDTVGHVARMGEGED